MLKLRSNIIYTVLKKTEKSDYFSIISRYKMFINFHMAATINVKDLDYKTIKEIFSFLI